MIKKFFTLSVFLIFVHCGFNPVYNVKNNLDYNIILVEKSGDKLINNQISNEINRISNSESSNILKLKLESNYQIIILSKDAKGSASEFQIIITSKFVIQKDLKEEIISYTEKQNYKKNSDLFDQKKYEENIKKNLASQIVRKFNLELLTKNDI